MPHYDDAKHVTRSARRGIRPLCFPTFILLVFRDCTPVFGPTVLDPRSTFLVANLPRSTGPVSSSQTHKHRCQPAVTNLTTRCLAAQPRGKRTNSSHAVASLHSAQYGGRAGGGGVDYCSNTICKCISLYLCVCVCNQDPCVRVHICVTVMRSERACSHLCVWNQTCM